MEMPPNNVISRDYWIEQLEEDFKRLAIPVFHKFQADILSLENDASDTSRFLGNQIWPPQDIHDMDADVNDIGKGRPNSCSCAFPGSIECVRKHVAEEKSKLQYELGNAFFRWRFDDMGAEVSRVWTPDEEKKFEVIVKNNPISRGKGKNIVDIASNALPCQSRESIISYYLNVYLPRRISMETRSGSGYEMVDTDDEGSGENPKSKGSRKRCQGGDDTSTSASSQPRYMTGKR